jgi:hypothetical protein
VDGDEMEAVLAIGTMFASHENQLQGIDACQFLKHCIWEFNGALGSEPMDLTPSAKEEVEKHNIPNIPYLGPINGSLPQFFTNVDGVITGRLERPANKERLDLLFGKTGSGETKDRKDATSVLDLLKRLPPGIKIHLILCRTCPGTPQKKTIQAINALPVTVRKAVFLQNGTVDLVPIMAPGGSTKAENNTLVVFVEMKMVGPTFICVVVFWYCVGRSRGAAFHVRVSFLLFSIRMPCRVQSQKR